jgi:Kef-type K+ transport system membrane component KefB
MAFGLSVAVAKAISSKGSTSLTATLLDPVIEIVGALFVGALLGVLLKFTASWFTGRGNRLSAASAFILLCIGISEMAGFSSLLTCMSMSAVFVNLSNASDKVMEQVDRFTPPVFMLFFFISGAGLDISILPSVGIIGLMYVIFRMVGKIVGTAFGAWISHAGAAVKKYLGYTLVPQAGVAIGLAGLATEVVPEYGSKIRTIILSATVIYELTGPVITKLALKKAGEII